MSDFAYFYAGMAALTALFVFADNRPRGIGEWLGFAGIALTWPAAFGFALYAAITRGRL